MARLLLLWYVTALASFRASVAVGGIVPAMFVFGDSLVDAGNNNDLLTLAKADYAPNGIDFSAGVTGRFCNGGTVADHLGDLLGLPLIPPFNNPSTNGSKILKGVNFASAASGILNDTGRLYGDGFPMDSQIQNFGKTVQELSKQMGGVTKFLEKSLILVCMGSNDYINNYLLPFSHKPKEYTPEAYAEMLSQVFRRQLQDLYDLGGRKFLIASLGPLGCIPNQIGNSGGNPDSCVGRTNQLALQFNNKLKAMLAELNTRLAGSYFLYWDTFFFTLDLINNYSKYGFKYQHKACCGAGRSKGQIICLPVLPLKCQNRSEYVFWDPYHPSDASNAIGAKYAYQGKLQSTFPMNVQQLARL